MGFCLTSWTDSQNISLSSRNTLYKQTSQDLEFVRTSVFQSEKTRYSLNIRETIQDKYKNDYKTHIYFAWLSDWHHPVEYIIIIWAFMFCFSFATKMLNRTDKLLTTKRKDQHNVIKGYGSRFSD